MSHFLENSKMHIKVWNWKRKIPSDLCVHFYNLVKRHVKSNYNYILKFWLKLLHEGLIL